MEKYKDKGGDSGINAFEIDTDSITIQFKDGSKYLYNYLRPGRNYVDQMKRLAYQGIGL
jgi:hypothetical protein